MTALLLEKLERLDHARQVRPGAWVARCPAHEDRVPSLSWTTSSDGRVLIKCHAGCTTEAVVAALGAEMADLFAPRRTNGHVAAARPVMCLRTTRYEIRDAAGEVQAVHIRHDYSDGTKRLAWQRPDGSVGLGGTPATALPLYNAHLVASWPQDAPLVIVEGEKAADALTAAGRHALGTVTGAATTPDTAVLAIVAGRTVTLWPDADFTGRSHMLAIARALDGIAAEVRWLEAPDDAPAGWDAANALAGADPVAVLRNLAARVGPVPPMLSAQTPTIGRAESMSSAPTVSAHTPAERAETVSRPFRFRTARELAEALPVEVPWRARPYVADSSITEVVGKIKAAGKTTLVTHLAAAVLDGLPFLGQPTVACPVVFLTEQPPSSLRETLRRADLLERDDFAVLTWADTDGRPWPDVVAAAVAECQARGARLLVIDTLSRFAGIRGDGENSAGEADAAMAPLQRAAAAGLAVVVLRHERKSGGEVGESGRGSSAFGGAVDIVLALRRGEGQTRPTVRVIHALSRFDETPETLVIELTPEGYVALGDEAAVAFAEARAAVLDVLPGQPATALPIDGLRDAIPGAHRSTVQRVIAELQGAGTIARVGAGKRGDPFRYFLPTLDGQFGQKETDDAPPLWAAGGAS